MKRFLLGTNWKMHKTFDEAEAYLKKVRILAADAPAFQFFMIPPFTHLQMAKEAIKDTDILLGAQNLHWEEEGNYTGEISPVWLQEIGVQIAELGHSERRQYYNENDADLNKKVKAALKFEMTPLLCVGERAGDKQFQVTPEVIRRQIKMAFFDVSVQQSQRLWVAYEPTWAIGPSGTPASADYVAYVHEIIREQLLELFGENGNKIPVLYGGSVNPQNCVQLANCKNVDGLFIGRAAWDIARFTCIVELLKGIE